MKIKPVVFAACRDLKFDAAAKATWFETFPPYGRYPVGGTIDGADPDAVFVFDEASAKAVIDAFNASAKDPQWPGVLVDEEHFSLDRSKSSAAMAWAKEIRQEEDGSVWTRWEWTPRGRGLWETKTLLSRSPAFQCEKSGNEYRPTALMSIGMTNTPHFKELSNLAAARAAEEENNAKGEIPMEKLKAELGLGEDAAEEAVLEAVKALKDKAAAAEATAAEATAKCRTMECDAFIEANKAKIADVAACREAYMANPEAAAKIIAACKAPEAKPQTVLASAKGTPKIVKSGDVASCREQLLALPPNERLAFYKAHAAEIDG